MIQHSILNFKSDYHSEYLNEDIINLLDGTFQIPEHYSYNIFEVTEEYIARPDLISLDAYGSTQFTDTICKLNGISNPFELNEGMKIIVPSPENIIEFNTTPNPNDFFEDSEIGTIPIKNKTDKRKANEAIVGDSRFKIDTNSRIIIY